MKSYFIPLIAAPLAACQAVTSDPVVPQSIEYTVTQPQFLTPQELLTLVHDATVAPLSRTEEHRTRKADLLSILTSGHRSAQGTHVTIPQIQGTDNGALVSFEYTTTDDDGQVVARQPYLTLNVEFGLPSHPSGDPVVSFARATQTRFPTRGPDTVTTEYDVTGTTGGWVTSWQTVGGEQGGEGHPLTRTSRQTLEAIATHLANHPSARQ